MAVCLSLNSNVICCSSAVVKLKYQIHALSVPRKTVASMTKLANKLTSREKPYLLWWSLSSGSNNKWSNMDSKSDMLLTKWLVTMGSQHWCLTDSMMLCVAETLGLVQWRMLETSYLPISQRRPISYINYLDTKKKKKSVIQENTFYRIVLELKLLLVNFFPFNIRKKQSSEKLFIDWILSCGM